MIIGRSSGLWKTGGTPLSLTFVREGQFVADGNGLMGTQVAKPSRGTVALRHADSSTTPMYVAPRSCTYHSWVRQGLRANRWGMR